MAKAGVVENAEEKRSGMPEKTRKKKKKFLEAESFMDSKKDTQKPSSKEK